jgi:hypothetical protein
MKYQIEALKFQVQELQQAKDSKVEVNIGPDGDYRSKTFDQCKCFRLSVVLMFILLQYVY